MEFNLKLENFEGPLELLLHLIEIKQMSIYDIQISQIIDSYLEVMQELKEKDINIKVEFLMMATELLEIKALNVLKYKEKEKKVKALERKLIEYKTIKDLSGKLRDMEVEYNMPHRREGRDIELDDYREIDLSKLSLTSVFNTYYKLLERNALEETLEIDIEETYSMEEEMLRIKENLLKDNKLSYTKFFEGAKSKLHLVYIFLAVLELYRDKFVELDKDYIYLEGSY